MSENNPKIFRYAGKTLDVEWDERLCIHVGECGRAEGNLFVDGRDPWCQPDLVSNDEVTEVVRRCPTGALSLKADGRNVEEISDKENIVQISNNGPLYLSGELNIEGAADDMPGVRYRAALCRCGRSNNKPFCDGRHLEVGFVDSGAVGKTGDGLVSKGGKLTVRAVEDGPLLFSGNFVLVAASGRVSWQGTKAGICRCGESKNKPFCDGSHKTAGFKSA